MTQNVIILEAKLTSSERAWYMQAVRQFDWSKSELLRQIEAEAHLTLDLPDEVCYTEENAVAEEDSSYAQDRQCHGVGSSGAADGVSALFSLPHLIFDAIHVIIRCIPQDRFESSISDKMFMVDRFSFLPTLRIF